MNKYQQHLIALATLFTIHFSFFISPAGAQKTLTILHTNDTHSTVMPLNKNLADTLFEFQTGKLNQLYGLDLQRRETLDLLQLKASPLLYHNEG